MRLTTRIKCDECGSKDWTTDADYGKLVCMDCGYQPRDPKEQKIREALPYEPGF